MDSMMDFNSAADSMLLTTGAAQTTVLGALTGFFATYFLLIVVLAVMLIIAQWKINSKAGEPGWACFIPIYANVVQFKIVGLNPWLLLLYVIPVVNVVAAVVFAIMVPFRLAKSFGKDIGWGFGLWLLPFIFNLILGFGKTEYVGPNGEVKF